MSTNALNAGAITLIFMFLNMAFNQQFSVIELVTLYYVVLLLIKQQDKEND